MTPRPRDTLVLTLPPEPGLARLVRLVSRHFFRQNGVSSLESRREARRVEERCRALWRSTGTIGAGYTARGQRGSGKPFVLTLIARGGSVEAIGPRDSITGRSRLTRIGRPDPT